ncbi:Peroxiredoxin [Lachnellula hyalina]|uniref:thioredoxin-dependent peroxiredoxin n=1 Tax=Lachnellula hyalina TaxID=1316788 RepID=A0A8H8U1N3_9HELO|nr:Peroxiredoxin [Lachnellula hyalina]TVY30596.1 Peroxiredoxin [Lachnellula hyalina]
MPPELRKRKAPATEPAAAPPAKKKGPVAKAVAKVKEAVAPKTKPAKTNGSAASTKAAVGDVITLEGFGGEIETNEGTKVTLKQLVDESKGGVVLFTYPKASTGGCTTQVCLFRDSYTPLTATGFSIYGLSKDSPKANTNFKEKQKLQYPLLCDPSASLISAIGLDKAGGAKRGVFVVDKSGKVLASEPGGPAATVAVVKKLVGDGESTDSAAVSEPSTPTVEEPKTEVPTANGINGTSATEDDVDQADVAAQVADTAEKLDSNEVKPVAV